MLLLQNTVVRFDKILSNEKKISKKEQENSRKYHIPISLDFEYCKIASIKKGFQLENQVSCTRLVVVLKRHY